MRHFVRPRIGNFELGRFSLGRNYQCLLVETTNSHRPTTVYFVEAFVRANDWARCACRIIT